MGPKDAKTWRYVANMNATMDDGLQDAPLDSMNYEDDKKRSKHNTKMLSVVVQEVLKAVYQKKQRADGSGNNNWWNFACIIYTLNVCSYYNMYDKNSWIIDPRALDHMNSERCLFGELKDLSKGVNVNMLDGSTRSLKQIETLVLSLEIIPKIFDTCMSLSTICFRWVNL